MGRVIVLAGDSFLRGDLGPQRCRGAGVDYERVTCGPARSWQRGAPCSPAVSRVGDPCMPVRERHLKVDRLRVNERHHASLLLAADDEDELLERQWQCVRGSKPEWRTYSHIRPQPVSGMVVYVKAAKATLL